MHLQYHPWKWECWWTQTMLLTWQFHRPKKYCSFQGLATIVAHPSIVVLPSLPSPNCGVNKEINDWFGQRPVKRLPTKKQCINIPAMQDFFKVFLSNFYSRGVLKILGLSFFDINSPVVLHSFSIFSHSWHFLLKLTSPGDCTFSKTSDCCLNLQ